MRIPPAFYEDFCRRPKVPGQPAESSGLGTTEWSKGLSLMNSVWQSRPLRTQREGTGRTHTASLSLRIIGPIGRLRTSKTNPRGKISGVGGWGVTGQEGDGRVGVTQCKRSDPCSGTHPTCMLLNTYTTRQDKMGQLSQDGGPPCPCSEHQGTKLGLGLGADGNG